MLQNCQKYQELAQLLSQLRSYASATQSQLDVIELRRRLGMVQQLFLHEIIPLTEENIESSEQPRVRSIQTEISKQLRLLEMDVMFLQGARQPATAKARLDGICDRIQTLIQYCDAILQTPTSEEEGEIEG
jgi:hypothetical protein